MTAVSAVKMNHKLQHNHIEYDMNHQSGAKIGDLSTTALETSRTGTDASEELDKQDQKSEKLQEKIRLFLELLRFLYLFFNIFPKILFLFSKHLLQLLTNFATLIDGSCLLLVDSIKVAGSS